MNEDVKTLKILADQNQWYIKKKNHDPIGFIRGIQGSLHKSMCNSQKGRKSDG